MVSYLVSEDWAWCTTFPQSLAGCSDDQHMSMWVREEKEQLPFHLRYIHTCYIHCVHVLLNTKWQTKFVGVQLNTEGLYYLLWTYLLACFLWANLLGWQAVGSFWEWWENQFIYVFCLFATATSLTLVWQTAAAIIFAVLETGSLWQQEGSSGISWHP